MSYLVHSSHGDLELDHDGVVVNFYESEEADHDGVDALSRILQFDLAEHQKAFPKEWEILSPESWPTDFDILELGYWYSGMDKSSPNKYEPPDYEFRQHLKTQYAKKHNLPIPHVPNGELGLTQ